MSDSPKLRPTKEQGEGGGASTEEVAWGGVDMVPEGPGGIEKSSITYRLELKRLWETHKGELLRSWHCVEPHRRASLLLVCRKGAVNTLSNNMTFTEESFAAICPELRENRAPEHAIYPQILQDLVENTIDRSKEADFKELRLRAPDLCKAKVRIEFVRGAKCADCEKEMGEGKGRFRYLYFDGSNDSCQHVLAKGAVLNMFLIARRMMMAEGLHTGVRTIARLIGVEEDPHEGQSLFPPEACGGCGRMNDYETEGPLRLVCGRCKRERYCRKECQRLRWKEHKKVCVSPDTKGTKAGEETEGSEPKSKAVA